MAWIDLLLLANHKPRCFDVRGNEVRVNRGEVGWAKESLAKRWRWSRGKVERFIKTLEMKQQIEQRKTPSINIIVLKNYELYQPNDTTNKTTDGHQTDIRQYTNNNVKNVKNDKYRGVNKKEYTSYQKEKGQRAKLFRGGEFIEENYEHKQKTKRGGELIN